MILHLLAGKWDEYNKKDRQIKLLRDTKEAILLKYPRTTVLLGNTLYIADKK